VTRMTLLTVDHLTIDYHTRDGDARVVDDVSFAVDAREIVGLVGESGSGKSAVVHAVAALPRTVIATTTGEVRLDGADMLAGDAKALRRMHGARIGFVGQNPFGSLHPTLRIATQFHHVLKAHGRTSSRRQSFALAEATLERVGIREPSRVLRGYAYQLSGGMAQRVVIGIATVLEPAFFIADEPTTALDPTVQIQILDLLRDLRDTLGMSILMVTHDLGVVANYCDRMLVMRSGRLLEQGTVRDLFRNPEDPYTRELLDVDGKEWTA
jgi:peptide/nickel transport system ATP-binding protein